MSFGQNLQCLRKMSNKMTQEELAERLSVSRQTVSKWELDMAYPEMDKLIELCNLFACSMDELVRGDLNLNDDAFSEIRMEKVEACYEREKEAFFGKIAEKNAKQAERNRARIGREKEEFAALRTYIVPEKYNLFHWPKKLDIQKLNKLYRLDAKMMQDEILADEIGLTLYLRCKYGKEDMKRMEKNIIRCHGCDAELGGETDFRQCACGRQYSYKEYRRSFRRDNMPTGAAAEVFSAYIRDWERAKCYEEKIELIDTLLHEFHLSLVSGVTHRPVAMNFIDGSRRKVEGIIKTLARK